MRMPRFRIRTMMLCVVISAVFLGVDAERRRLFNEPPLSVNMFLLEAILVAMALPFISPIAWLVYLTWKENAHWKWLQRDDTPAHFPRSIAASDWPRPNEEVRP